jgi:preprotein translocase subunit SecE
MPLWLTVCLVVVAVLAVIGVIAYAIDRLNHQVTRNK